MQYQFSHFDALLNTDVNGKLTTQLCNKVYGFIFLIVTVPHLYSNILSLAHMVFYVSQLIRQTIIAWFAYYQFLNIERIMANKKCYRSFNSSD